MLHPGSQHLLRRLVLAVLLALAVPAAAGAQPGPLFPEPFRVEHHLVQDDGDGSRFVGEPVTDTYGGSWIVSQRPDGSRLIVDLVRRELTEVRTAKGVYWTVSFDRLAELQAHLRAAQGLARTTRTPDRKQEGEAKAASPAQKNDAAAELTVTEVPAGNGRTKSTARSSASALEARPGVKRLRVTRGGDSTAAFEAWVDPSLRLTPAALAALSALETGALSGPAPAPAATATAKSAEPSTPSPAEAPGRYLAAARLHAAGAFPIHTRHPAAAPAGANPMGSVEDVATRLDRLERFPSALAEIPEGLKKVPHPLEAAVRFLEEDAERNAALAGRRTGPKP
jgi:hypothetical protein